MNKQQFYDAAIFYTKEKHYSVIPVGMDKRPLIDWKFYQTTIASEKEISEWSNFSDVQLGIVTGALSNLTVVDVEAGGDTSFLPQNTFIVETGGGGAHFYFQFCSEMRNKARVRELVDIRSEGGYVVAPGSVSSKGEYKIAFEAPLLPFPLSVFQIDKKSSERPRFAPGTSTQEVNEYPGYGPGSRNQEMTRFIGHVLTKIHPALWDTEAWQIICSANEKNIPPLPEKELQISFESIKKTEVQNNPRRWMNDDKNFMDEFRASVKKEWETHEESGDGRIMLMSDVAREQRITIDKFYPLGFPIFDSEIMGGAIPGDLISIAGMPGEGKTSFAMNLSRNFIQNQGSVLFFSYEVLIQFVWDKFKKMGMEDEAFLYCPFKNVSGSVDWIEKKIHEAKKDHDVKFVVIDHLGFLAPRLKSMSSRSSDNYTLFLTSILRELKTIAKNDEIIIVLPVHMRKKESFYKKNTELDINDIAHTSGVAQESDLVFLIQREKDTRTGAPDMHSGYSHIVLAKNRRGSKNPKGFFTMVNEMFVYDETYGGIEEEGGATRGRRSYGRSYRENPLAPLASMNGYVKEELEKETQDDIEMSTQVDDEAGLFDITPLP